MSKPLAIFTPDGMAPDAGAVTQMNTCMNKGDAVGGVLCADHHLGYSMPIGGAIAYPEYVSPSGVGFDIGCGNKAVATSLLYSDISNDLKAIMDQVAKDVSFGMGVPAQKQTDHEVFDAIRASDNLAFKDGSLLATARKQLGTVGSGNHYVDLFREEGTDRVWVGVHFGSRGFGHKIASGFMALHAGKQFHDHPPGESMMAEPILFKDDDWLGVQYLEAMELAGRYAYAGRDTVVNQVLGILGNPDVTHEVHNHHNFLWREEIDGQMTYVVRKGCTPLYPGQQGFVGGSMGDNAVIIEGTDLRTLEGHAPDQAERSLFSAPHGAGRIMSRTEARGKQRKRAICNDCGHLQGQGEATFTECPECHSPEVRKEWVTITPGVIDWKGAKAKLKMMNIELRGGDADEAPGAYKRLPEVLAAHEPYVAVKHQLRPIGVAMAGAGTVDKYKD